MKNIAKSTLKAVSSVLLISACTNYDINQINNLTAKSSFTNGLKIEYISLAEDEIEEVAWCDAALFLHKAEMAALGAEVPPENLVDHYLLPDNHIPVLESARFWLSSALKEGAAEKIPYAAAHAQAMFDCWVEEQEENHQPNDIARCRSAFETAMIQVDAALTPPIPKKKSKAVKKPRVTATKPKPILKTREVPKQEPEPAIIPGPFIVYFAFDSALMTDAANKVVMRAVRAAQTAGKADIELRGHADTAGPNRYNTILSGKRVLAVYDELISWGISRERISYLAVGEEEPAVKTEDGVREALNRRVVITVN